MMNASGIPQPRVDLSRRERSLRELMDDPDCDPQRLHATLRRFDLVNRLVSGWGTVYRTRLRSLLAELPQPARVLDIGSGGGDVVLRLAKLAERDGIEVQWAGVDPDPRAHRLAQDRQRPGVRFLCTDAETLLDRGETFDIVLSNHVLHHLDDGDLPSFADTSRRLAHHVVYHGDIARGRLAYGLFAAGITPLAPGTFLRTDGLRSIRRSYRRAELAAALGPEWEIEAPAPFRLLARGGGLA